MPTTEEQTVAPDTARRRPNAELRFAAAIRRSTSSSVRCSRERTAATVTATPTMLLVAYRHGLRASELTDLRWDQIDFSTANLHVRRAKRGTPATHPILGDELRALRRLQREQAPKSPFVFTTERGGPFTTAGFARIVRLRPGERAWRSRLTLTCFGTPAASSLPTMATTPARCRLTWATRTSSTRCAIPSWRQRGSKAFGVDTASARWIKSPAGMTVTTSDNGIFVPELRTVTTTFGSRIHA
jgi:hypothetical protein